MRFYSYFHSLTFIFLFLLLITFHTSCGTTKYIYLPGETKIEYRDSTVYRDSIEYRPVEVIKEIVPELDTLKLETSLARSEAYLDTTHRVLRGKIENKQGISTQIHYKDRIVYRDSIVTKPVPVEVQVEKKVKVIPWYNPILWFLSILFVISIVIKYIRYRLSGKGQ